jgi:hypothetical protein
MTPGLPSGSRPPVAIAWLHSFFFTASGMDGITDFHYPFLQGFRSTDRQALFVTRTVPIVLPAGQASRQKYNILIINE